jgi:hemoglobin
MRSGRLAFPTHVMTHRRQMRTLRSPAWALCFLTLGPVGLPRALAAPPAAATPSGPSLYQLFGEKAGIQAIVDDFMRRTLADPRVASRFDKIVTPKLKETMFEQMCVATGGPCVYHGRDMKAAHLNMHISNSEYDALTEDLVAALDARHIPKEAQQRFLVLRDRSRSQIVEPPLAAADATTPPPAGNSPTLLRARDFYDAAKILEMVDGARARGNLPLATRLFSSVELVVGSPAVADLYPLYNKGVPPRAAEGAPDVSTAPQPRLMPLPAEEQKPSPAQPTRAVLTGKLVVGGKVLSDGVGLVMLRPLDRPAKPRAAQVRTMEQRGRDFAPHLLVVPVGSTVNFPNFDPVYHNVYSSSDVKSFDLGVYRNGESRALLFDKPGIIQVECSVHENMVAYIAVVSEPFVAIAEDGSFSFRALVPGRYKLRAWTERSGKVTEKDIVIKSGDNVLAVEVDGRPSGHQRTDKFGNPRAAAR